ALWPRHQLYWQVGAHAQATGFKHRYLIAVAAGHVQVALVGAGEQGIGVQAHGHFPTKLPLGRAKYRYRAAGGGPGGRHAVGGAVGPGHAGHLLVQGIGGQRPAPVADEHAAARQHQAERRHPGGPGPHNLARGPVELDY
nr:hypothetical protein [Tanacetum cinerariifolium]